MSDSLRPHGLQPGQAPLSMGFSRQEFWSGLPCPPPGDLSDPGIELRSPALADRFFTAEPSGKPLASVEIIVSESCGSFQRIIKRVYGWATPATITLLHPDPKLGISRLGTDFYFLMPGLKYFMLCVILSL